MTTRPGPSGVTALVIAVALLHGGPHLEAGPAANKLALSSPASVSPDPYDVSRGSARPRRPIPQPAHPPDNGPPTDPGRKDDRASGDKTRGRSGDDDRGRGHGPAKIIIQSVTDSPDPLRVGTDTATFLVRANVRISDGLNAEEHHNPQGDRHTVLVRVRIGLAAPSGETVTLTKDVVVTPPLTRRRLNHRGRLWVHVTVPLTWNGLFPGAVCPPKGVTPYTVVAQFLRETRQRRSRGLIRTKLIDEASAAGTITLTVPPPVLVVTAPAQGDFVRQTTVQVSGTVTSVAPADVSVNSGLASVVNGAFAASREIPEGPSLVTVVATNCHGASVQVTRGVFRDTRPPIATITAPTSKGFVNTTTPTLSIEFFDPVPSSGIDLSSFRASLNGEDVSDRFTVTATGATFTPSAMLEQGPQTLVVRISDKASHQSEEATSVFVVDTIAPEILVDMPAPRFVTSVSPITVAGTVRDASPIRKVTVDSTVAQLVENRFEASVPLVQDGPVLLRVVARDAAGNAGLLIVGGIFDTHPPDLRVIAPAAGSFLTSSPVEVTGFVSDLTRVVVTVGGVHATLIGSSFTAKVPVAPGQNAIEVVARDEALLESRSELRVFLDLKNPSITIEHPADQTTVTTATPELLVTYFNGESGISPESFQADLDGVDISALFVATASQARVQLTPQQAIAPGPHRLQCSISDRSGRRSTTASTFQVVLGPLPPRRVEASGFMCGKVLNGATDQPLGGVSVTVQGLEGTLLTSADGTYDFPTLGSGEFLITMSRPGYTSAQRRARLVRGRDTAIPPAHLIPLDPKKTAVQASVGGVVSDSTGRITLTIPPGALPHDTQIQITDIPRSKFLPAFLPAQSQYLAAVSIEPSMKFLAPVRLRYRFRITSPFPAGTRIPVGRYDLTAGAWVHAAMATVTSDGLHAEADVHEVSTLDINPPSQGSSDVFFPLGEEPTPGVSCSLPEQVGASFVLADVGAFQEEHELPPNAGEDAPLRLVYRSDTVDPQPLVHIKTLLDDLQTPLHLFPRDSMTFEFSVGTRFRELFYTPKGGSSLSRYRWDALDRDGHKVSTGSYPYTARIAHSYRGFRFATALSFGDAPGAGIPGSVVLEPVRRWTAVEGRLRVVNRKNSPFGSGWGLEGLSRLHFDPDGWVVLEEGSGASTVYGSGNVVYMPDETILGYVVIDATRREKVAQVVLPSPAIVLQIVPHPDGSRAFLATSDSRVYVTDFQDHKPRLLFDFTHLGCFPFCPQPVIAPTPDGRRMFVALTSPDREVQMEVVDLVTLTHKVIVPFGLGGRLATDVAVSSDGKRAYCLLAARSDRVPHSDLAIVNLETNQIQGFIALPPDFRDALLRLAVSPDGRMGVVSGPPGLFLVDLVNLTPMGSLVPGFFHDVAFTSDGRKLVATSRAGVYVRDLQTQLGLTIDMSFPGPNSLALTPDGKGAYVQATVEAGSRVFYVDLAALTTTQLVPAVFATSIHHGSAGAAVVINPDLFVSPPGDFSRLVRTLVGTFVHTMPNGRVTEFDARGLQLAVQEASGRRTTYAYDTDKRLVMITHPGQEGVTTFTYASTGLRSIVDRSGRVTELETDAQGRRTSITNPAGGGTRRFLYDDQGRMTKSIDGMGSISTITYGPNGQVQEVLARGEARTTLVAQDSQGLANDVPEGAGTETSPTTPVSSGTVAARMVKPVGGPLRIALNSFGHDLERTDVLGATTLTQRDSQGLPRSVTDPLGRTTSFTHTPQGLVSSIKAPDGATHGLAYVQIAGATVPVSYRRPSGATTTAGYNQQALPTAISNPIGQVTTIGYAAGGLVSKMQTPSGRATTIDYTPFSAPTVVTQNPVANQGPPATTTIAYDTARNPVQITDPLGFATTLTHDGMGRPVSIKDQDQNTTLIGYDADGNPTSVTDTRGNQTAMTWLSGKRLANVRNALGQSTQIDYSPAGLLLKATTFRNEVTSRGYDELSRLALLTDALGGKLQFGYDRASQLTTVTDQLSNVTAFQRDVAGRIRSIRTADGKTAAVGYNLDGEITSVTDPSSRTSSIERDDAGRVTALVDGAGKRTTIARDTDGRVSSVTDPLQRRITYTYDGLGRPSQIRLADGVSYQMKYDLRGNIESITSARSGKWEFAYTPAGRLERVKDPNNHETRYKYDGEGNVTRVDQPGENARIVTDYTYDALNRPLSITTPERTYSISYNDPANSMSVTIVPDAIGIVRRRDALGRLVAETIISGLVVRAMEYSWDAASNLTHVRQNGVAVLSFTHDSMNRPITIKNEREARTFTLSYTPSGELAEIVFPSGIKKVQSWGSRGELSSIEYRKGGGTAISRETYSYDNALQLTKITDLVGEKVAYQYDRRGQVIRADYRGGGFEAFQYDSCGNIIGYQRPGLSEVKTHDLADQLTVIKSTAGANPTTTTSLVYDPRGNLRSLTKPGETRELVWDADGRLRRVSDNGTQKLAARYLDDYRLDQLETPADGVTGFGWMFGNIVSEFTASADTVFNVGLLGLDETLERGPPNGAKQVLIANQVGSTEAVVDELAELLRSTLYGAYGPILDGQDPGPIGFHGARRDPGTGLTYLRNRWYSPELGRFISPDPIGFAGGFNLYAYAHGNPINYRDPSGLNPLLYGILKVSLGIAWEGLKLSAVLAGTYLGVKGIREGTQRVVDAPNYPGNTADKLTQVGLGAGEVYINTAPVLAGAGVGAIQALRVPMSCPPPTSGERFYRSMSQADYAKLMLTGELPATAETVVSPTAEFAANYRGELVEFMMEAGTTEELLRLGVRDASTAVSQLHPQLPLVQKGWTASNALFKFETNQINIGLGRGAALDRFNQRIIGIQHIAR